jgi:hypothetical protein
VIDGELVGSTEGDNDGFRVGPVGIKVGHNVGCVGLIVGNIVGLRVRPSVGCCVGPTLGIFNGSDVGVNESATHSGHPAHLAKSHSISHSGVALL